MESPLPSEAHKDQLFTAFIEQISPATGAVIALNGRKSRLGEPFYISARLGEDLYHPDPNLRFANIDVFVLRGEQFVPVGIKDYEIHGQIANGNKQRHQHLAATHPAHEAADRFWSTGQGMHVRELDYVDYAGSFERMNKMREGIITDESQWLQQIYQQYGIGKLMIGVSLYVLQYHGITHVEFGRLTQNAEKAWRYFGYNGEKRISVADTIAQPATKNSILAFI